MTVSTFTAFAPSNLISSGSSSGGPQFNMNVLASSQSDFSRGNLL